MNRLFKGFRSSSSQSTDEIFTSVSEAVEYIADKQQKTFCVALEDRVMHEDYFSKTNTKIPMVVESIISTLNGIPLCKKVGIFRESGNKLKEDIIMKRIDSGEQIDWFEEDPYELADILKTYFRKLPIPLFPFYMYNELIESGNIKDETTLLERLSDLSKSLPTVHRIVARALFWFLREISIEPEYKMNAHNLAVCWGQNLIRPETLSPTTLAHTSNVNKITEAMIQHVEEIFSNFTDLETEVSQMFSKNKKGTFDIFGVKSSDRFSPSECATKLVDGIIMLKYSRRRATNHFRLFKMTHNLEYLVWGSHKKDVYGSSISVRDIKVMTCGVDTQLKLDDGKLAQYAISLRYGRKSKLDLVCKTQEEHFIVSQALAYCIMEVKTKFSTRPSKASSIHAPVTAIVDITKELQSEAAKLGDLYTWGATLGQAKYIPSIINKLVNVDIIEFAVGSNAYAAINSNGQLYTWGGGKSSDLLGHCTADTVQSPQLVTALANTKVTRVAMGAKHCLILDNNGYVYACGDNKYGQLGLTHVSTTNQPTKITQDVRFMDIFCGYSHSGLLTTEGDLLLFGRGDKDQLGYTTAELSNATPKRLELGWERVVSCVMGKMHTMILLDDGSVRSFGGAGFGQLGLGTEDLSQRAEPKEILFFRENNVNVIQLAAGGRSSGCVTHDGSMYVWGDISSTGLVSYGCFQFVPLKLTLDGPGSKLCLGEDHALVLLQNGEVLSFGNNEGGALGRGENVPNTKAPISMLIDKKIRAIACGGRSSACICAHEWTNPALVTNCAGCKQPFSKFRQKYNCCNCGGIFCDKCSKKKAVLLRFGHVDPVRVCDECHKALQQRQ